jgi:hypothetical protein
MNSSVSVTSKVSAEVLKCRPTTTFASMTRPVSHNNKDNNTTSATATHPSWCNHHGLSSSPSVPLVSPLMSVRSSKGHHQRPPSVVVRNLWTSTPPPKTTAAENNNTSSTVDINNNSNRLGHSTTKEKTTTSNTAKTNTPTTTTKDVSSSVQQTLSDLQRMNDRGAELLEQLEQSATTSQTKLANQLTEATRAIRVERDHSLTKIKTQCKTIIAKLYQSFVKPSSRKRRKVGKSSGKIGAVHLHDEDFSFM